MDLGGAPDPPRVGDRAAIRTDLRATVATADEDRRRDEERIGLRQEVADLRARLAAVESHFRGVVDTSTDGVVVINREGIVVYANSAAGSMLGDGRSPLVGTLASFPVVSTATRRSDHESFLAELRVVSTEWEGEPAVLGMLRDMTERSLADAEMAFRATHDPVTGLP